MTKHNGTVRITDTTAQLQLPTLKHAYIVLTPLNPTIHSKNWGFAGVYIIFHISAQKHRLWVLVRTASAKRF